METIDLTKIDSKLIGRDINELIGKELSPEEIKRLKEVIEYNQKAFERKEKIKNIWFFRKLYDLENKLEKLLEKPIFLFNPTSDKFSLTEKLSKKEVFYLLSYSIIGIILLAYLSPLGLKGDILAMLIALLLPIALELVKVLVILAIMLVFAIPLIIPELIPTATFYTDEEIKNRKRERYEYPDFDDDYDIYGSPSYSYHISNVFNINRYMS